ncbi:MAG: peptide deformylase [Deltaproteobacteria bacterium]
MGNILEITELGDPVLREKASGVENIHDDSIQNFIDDLIETGLHANGVGIAAPQVNESKRIFIISSHPSVRYPNAPEMKPVAIINPEIISTSEELVKDWEGCLSIPGIRGMVPRHKSIHARYFLRNGSTEEREFTGFIARIFQHEYDHINGILFPDRLESNKDLITEKEYRKIISAEDGKD